MKNLRELRKEKGFRTNFIAQKLNISTRHLERIENGQGYLTTIRAEILSQIYNVGLDTINDIYKRSNFYSEEKRKT